MVCEILKHSKHWTIFFMNNNSPLWKKTSLAILSVFFTITSFAQLETAPFNGASYNVYPLQKEVRSMQDYYYQFADYKEVIRRDGRNEKIVSVKDTLITKEEKKGMFNYKGKYKKYEKQMVEILEKYSYFMVTADNSLNVDPTPALVSLPDGKYIQYYRDIPYIKNRVLRYRNDIVAGVFEIKNNMLEGPSTWYMPNGQVVRTGNYHLGEKSGTWMHYTLEEKNTQESYDEKMSLEDRLKILVYDTTSMRTDFKNGLKDGPFVMKFNDKVLVSGHFTKDVESGSWEIYSFKQRLVIDKKEDYLISSDTLILTLKYTLRADSIRGKSKIMRHGAVYPDFIYSRTDSLFFQNVFPESNSYFGENYRTNTLVNFNFDNFYSILKNPPMIEMDEETVSSYEGEMYPDDYEGGYMLESEIEQNVDEYYEYVNNKRYTLNNLIDSMGYLMKYEGIYERYYTNGQLQFKCSIANGTIQDESPVFWDNGKIADEIVFLPDSNQYIQNFYDYRGKKYYQIGYDSKGNVLNDPIEYDPKFIFEGLGYEQNVALPTYIYENYDSLAKGVNQPIIYSKDLFKQNLKTAAIGLFDPTTKTITVAGYNLLGDTVAQSETVFSDDYATVHHVGYMQVGNLRLERIQNGSINEYYVLNRPDTISEQVNAYYWQNKYTLDNDDILKVNGQPFTGQFNLSREKKSFRVSATDKAIQLTLPTVAADHKLYNKQIPKYIESGKAGTLLPYFTANFMGSSYLSYAVTNFFPVILYVFTDMYGTPNYDAKRTRETEEYEQELIYETQNQSKIVSIDGSYLNGKPEGLWLFKDKKGVVLFSMNYKAGEPHGESISYDVAYPESKAMEQMSEYDYDPSFFYRKFPKKKTRYMSNKSIYKNGMKQGPDVQFDWNGDTLSYTQYIEGRKEGRSFERNIFFYSEAYYQNNLLDGIVKTYITRPKKDSVLLYDLNFKSGLLQGESKAYHTNGNIAKKGFFLTGEPIDDYEAYDTLGFRYQYVKFQFGQPVEEKIWEENELSVRYEFDWRDSIPFDFSDITSATSVEGLLYQLGYESEEMYQPYLGRPSLTYKGGIDYTVTKYYPNDTVARKGLISKGKKSGCWYYYNYKGVKLYEVDYFDTILVVNDSVQFKAKGILSYVDGNNQITSKSWIIEKIEKYDCAHTDHTEERMLYCFWQQDSSQNRISGYVRNYYENGNVQNEGWVKNGLPTGIWKMYDVNGNLSRVGAYEQGKRTGRWLEGDLGNVKNMSEICLNPNLENLEEILSYQEKLIDITVIIYDMGTVLKRKYYGINMNSGEAPDGYREEGY